MSGMHMVQPAVDQVIDMVAVRHRLVPAAGAVHMATAIRLHGAAVGVGRAHRDHMLVYMVAMHMVQMAIMQIVDMAVVQHRGMPAVLAMGVGVIGVCRAAHGRLLSNQLYIYGVNETRQKSLCGRLSP